jgi:hypothetical protein
MHLSWSLALISVLILLLNIPFGYWRAATKRFSWQWYLAIHIPVPVIVLVRIKFDVGWHWSTYLLFILAFSLGQFIGGSLRRCFKSRSSFSNDKQSEI